MKTIQDTYKKYFIDNNLERKNLCEAIKQTYSIHNALYPGSFIHIALSFFIPTVIYVDTDRQAKRFFKDRDKVQALIDSNKTYPQEARFDFIGQDYTDSLDVEEESFDLLISQYAGIISQPCKTYLKIGGLLLANNSHADAGAAFLDKDYELIAVIHDIGGQITITEDDLTQYGKPKSAIKPTMESLMKSGKGIQYAHTADNYLFKRIK